MSGFYNAEKLAADWIWNGQAQLLRAVDLVDEMGRLEHEAVVRNGDLADDIVIKGRELARMMREFSSIIDRTVPSRF